MNQRDMNGSNGKNESFGKKAPKSVNESNLLIVSARSNES